MEAPSTVDAQTQGQSSRFVYLSFFDNAICKLVLPKSGFSFLEQSDTVGLYRVCGHIKSWTFT